MIHRPVPVEEYSYLRGEFPGIPFDRVTWTTIEALRAAQEAHTRVRAPDYHRDHLSPVVRILAEALPADHPRREEILCAGALHDVFEDTYMDRRKPVPLDWPCEVDAVTFWSRVYEIVAALTDEPGRNRRARHEATYPKIRAYGPDAVAVKLADREQNVTRCWTGRDSRLFMYEHEQSRFYTALYRPEDPPYIHALWERVNTLLGFDPSRDRGPHR